jgi:hypothetical protein
MLVLAVAVAAATTVLVAVAASAPVLVEVAVLMMVVPEAQPVMAAISAPRTNPSAPRVETVWRRLDNMPCALPFRGVCDCFGATAAHCSQARRTTNSPSARKYSAWHASAVVSRITPASHPRRAAFSGTLILQLA